MSRYPTLLNSNTFIKLPIDYRTDDEITLEHVHELTCNIKTDFDLLRIASVVHQLLLSLRGTTYTLKQIVQLWQLRITLLCYISGKSIKLPESDTHFKIQSVKFIKNEVDILIPELYKISRLRKQHELSYNNTVKQQRQLDNFPREIGDDFKFLLMKIRFGSSLMLVNEYYSHMWRSQDTQGRDRLCFSIIAILALKQEFMTILSLIDSVLGQVETEMADKLVLLKLIISLFRANKDKLQLSNREDLKESFKKSMSRSEGVYLQQLNKILCAIPPIYNDPESFPVKEGDPLYGEDMDLNFQLIEEQVKLMVITGRIACALCAQLEIDVIKLDESASTGEDGEETSETDKQDHLISESLKKINEKWDENLTKFYGLE